MSVWYCYAISRALPGGALAGVRGVSESEVDTVERDGLTAVVSPVAAADFSEEALRSRLEDLDWLGETARRHNAVVDAVANSATALPCRLATVYLDRERVDEVLREGAAGFTAALDRLDGRVEWGVKVYATARTRTAATVPADTRDTGDSPGRAYLRRRGTERRAAEDSLQAATAKAGEVDEALDELAEDARRYRAQNPELSGASGHNVLNAAYLVGAADGEAFLARVTELRDANPDCRIEVTGPWVPYSFVPEEAQ